MADCGRIALHTRKGTNRFPGDADASSVLQSMAEGTEHDSDTLASTNSLAKSDGTFPFYLPYINLTL